MSISEQQKKAIFEIYNQEISIPKLFLFDQIPEDKLKNARKGHASLSGSDETVVMLFDDTLFGSAREGFLLTTNRFYSKNIMEAGTSVSISNIIDMSVDSKALAAQITIKTDGGTLTTHISQAPDSDQKAALFRILNKTIEILNSQASNQTDINASRPLQCRGCGAPLNVRAVSCEYCGISY